MNKSLNGTCWGELPENDWELEVPEFMTNTAYTVPTEVPVSAYCGQAMGRERRRRHREAKAKRQTVNGVFWSLVGFGLFAAAVNLVELIC